MRIVLTLLCALMILFAGGCATLALAAGLGPFAAIPAGIAALNVMVILFVNGGRRPNLAAFATLAALDLLIGGLFGVSAVVQIVTMPVGDGAIDGWPIAAGSLGAGLLLKGVLTVAAAWTGTRCGRPGAAAAAGLREDTHVPPETREQDACDGARSNDASRAGPGQE